VTTMSDAN